MKKTFLAAAMAISAATAAFAEPVAGTWKTQPGDTGGYLHVKIAPCGNAVCGNIDKAFDASGQTVSYGGEMVLDSADTATLRLAVSGAQGQRLMLYRNGQLAQSRLILSDEEIVQLEIQRAPASEGPLGTWWRFDLVADGLIFNGRPVIGPATTLIGNPVFLSAPLAD